MYYEWFFERHVYWTALEYDKKILDSEASRKTLDAENKRKASSAQDRFVQEIIKKTPEQLLNDAIDQRLKDMKVGPRNAHGADGINKTGLAVAAMGSGVDEGRCTILCE